MNKLTHVLSRIYGTPWAVMPEKLKAIVNFIEMKSDGMTFTKEELDGRFKAGPDPWEMVDKQDTEEANKIAVIPVFGTIGQRMNLMMDFSGGTSTEKLGKDITKAANDASIKAIVLDIDSPGGTVGGVPELSKVIFEARQKKHIVALSNSLMASAAYWLGSSASEIVVTPSGEVGSIGVFTIHQDVSAMHDKMGVKTTIISAGKFKTEGNPFEPLGEEAEGAIQSDVDEFYSMFVQDVARNRGVSTASVVNGFGQGRVLSANRAVNAGMVDRIETLDETLKRLTNDKNGLSFIRSSAGGTPIEKSSNKEVENQPLTRDEPVAETKSIDYDLERKKLDTFNV